MSKYHSEVFNSEIASSQFILLLVIQFKYSKETDMIKLQKR